MPIDPNVLTPTLIKPISVAGVVHDAAVVQEAQARAQAYRDKQMELAQDRQENEQIRGILQQSGGQLDDQTFAAIRQVSVPKAMDIEKLHNDSVKSSFEIDNSKIDHDLKVLNYTSRQLAGITDQHSYDMARAGIKATTGQDLPEQYDPALVQSWQEKGMTYAEKLSQQREDRAAKFQELTATRQQTAEDRAQAAQTETMRHNRATEGIAGANLAVRRQEAAKPAGGAGPSGGQSDVKETVAGMIDGTLPPVLPGRATKEYNAIMAESHRQKFDLAKAAQDWQATTKYLGTLNGQQQTRLRQAVVQVKETVPLIRSLVSEWDSYGIPYLSKANLEAAKKGTYGNKAQSLANRLDAQIADVTSELGTVYKGGNSSTDESLKLAASNLQSDWSKKAALDALDQIEQNIKYRENSMKLGPVTGGDNRYSPNLSGPKEGDTQPITAPGYPAGAEKTFKNGKWIRTK